MAKIFHRENDPFYKFNKLVDKNAAGGCWNWVGWVSVFGYGMQRFGGRKEMAHRYSYQLHLGPVPDGFNVCHKCDNPKCVNPDHLFLGTQKENIQDCVRKGRFNRHSKLTSEKIKEIRALYKSRKHTQDELGDLFGVSRTNISLIVNNKRWIHI